MPRFTSGRADFPLFPQAVSLPSFGKDNQWAGLPEKGKSVVGPWAGFKEGWMSAWRAQSWSNEVGSPLAASALVPIHRHLIIRALARFLLDPSGFLSALPS